ncbi:MAG: hypothetical protein HY302_00840 [Opitutae bacterium]|nr:hypothetical protein [Opitutae bacterium]
MTIYFLDDQESQRKMLSWDLRSLFGNDFEIASLPLKQDKTEYHRFLDDTATVGVLIDQCLNESGEVTGFSGLDLALHLRGLYREMPIYLITGFAPDEQMGSADAGSVEDIVKKDELRTNTVMSQLFKQRFLRHIGRYQEALTARQARYRELLTKSLQETIMPEERTELQTLEVDRLLPSQAEDEAHLATLNEQVAAVEKLLANLRGHQKTNE